MIIDLEKLKNYIGKSNCIHCDTEEKANELLKCLHKLGWRWASGQPLIGHNFYSEYGKETCYHLNIRNTLSYGSVVFYPKGNPNAARKANLAINKQAVDQFIYSFPNGLSIEEAVNEVIALAEKIIN